MKILDTDVAIEILRGNDRVIEARYQSLDEVVTTWITACELAYGAAKSRSPDKNQIARRHTGANGIWGSFPSRHPKTSATMMPTMAFS